MKNNLFLSNNNCIIWKAIPLTFFLLFLYSGIMIAQSSLNASGGEATGSGGSVSFSIGQVLNEYKSGANAYLIEGVQQPFEISVLTHVKNHVLSGMEMKVYPNPANETISLMVPDIAGYQLKYTLYDVLGHQHKMALISDQMTEISLINLPAMAYYLTISDRSGIIVTFQILKTN